MDHKENNVLNMFLGNIGLLCMWAIDEGRCENIFTPYEELRNYYSLLSSVDTNVILTV